MQHSVLRFAFRGTRQVSLAVQFQRSGAFTECVRLHTSQTHMRQSSLCRYTIPVCDWGSLQALQVGISNKSIPFILHRLFLFHWLGPVYHGLMRHHPVTSAAGTFGAAEQMTPLGLAGGSIAKLNTHFAAEKLCSSRVSRLVALLSATYVCPRSKIRARSTRRRSILWPYLSASSRPSRVNASNRHHSSRDIGEILT